jgi:predicted dehydrogenase
MNLTRRRFLTTTAAGAAAIALPVSPLHARRLRRRASDEIRVAVIGFNGRGRDHIGNFSKMEGVRVVALCDADSNVLAREEKALSERGISAFTCTDMRRIMDRTDVDAVSIATPNHWHALAGIWACQSGKDVYVEKPVSHNVWEGRQLVNAARKYDRIVQAGTQARSSTAIAEAFAWMRAGNLGTIKLARGMCYKPRRSIGKVDGPQTVASSIDYDLWTGPAQMKPLMRKKLHYDWHWDFNTGNGDLGNQGIHQMDLCRWALGETRLAPAVGSIGERFGYEDDGNTPNTQVTWFGYKTPLIFEVRGLPRDTAAQAEKWEEGMDKYKGMSIGVAIECEGGYIAISDNYDRVRAYDSSGTMMKEWTGKSDHFANFIGAVKSRKSSDLAADIEEGHISSALCHLGNIAHVTGIAVGRQGADVGVRQLPRADVVAESFDRFAAHLDANGVDLDRTPARLGAWLAFDPTSERFLDDERANRLLRREGRDSFVVPAIG